MFAMITNGYTSGAMESLTYFGLEDQVALEGFKMSSVIGILTSLLEKIKKLIKTLQGWASNIARWFKTKVLQLGKLKYIIMPKTQFNYFKDATNDFVNIIRFFTFVVPQLVAIKVRIFGKIGKAIKSSEKSPIALKIVGDILSQANTIADSLDKIAEDTKNQSLTLQFTAYGRFINYQPVEGEQTIRVPIANLKMYMTINDKFNDLYTAVTESFTEIQDGIKDYIEVFRKDEDGNGLLNNEDVDTLIASLTKMPAILGRVSNMMVVVTNNSMVMINTMLAMQEQTPDPLFKKKANRAVTTA